MKSTDALDGAESAMSVEGAPDGAESAMSAADTPEDSEPVTIIAGPTAAGKSAIAIALAERFGASLISADSRQIYRKFNIGTAKPSAEEQKRVRHFGIDIIDPTERFSAARWAACAVGWLESVSAKPIVVGGTGLWLRALVQPLADEPEMDPRRREVLQREMELLSTETLRRWVQELDPPRAPLGRTQLIRAVETALLTGTRISDWHAAGASKPRRKARWLIVDPGDALRLRITERIDRMLADGWIAEVEELIKSVPGDAPAWNACGYREIRNHVLGLTSLASAREATIISTRQYAKRQRTWFRNQLESESEVVRINPLADGAMEAAMRWFTGAELERE